MVPSPPKHSPEAVAGAAVQLLQEGINGGVMVVEPGKEPYYVDPEVK